MKSKIKITDTVVERAALPEGKSEFMIWDTEVTGFGLRLRGEAKSYVISYRPAGAGRSANTKRVKIGTPETIKTPTEARKIAFAMLGKVAAGGDPAKDRATERRREKSRVRDLLDRYEEDLTRRKYVAKSMVLSILRRGLKRHLDKDIGDLKGVDYVAIMDGLERSGLPGAADAFRSRCRAFLTFCMVRAKVIDANPLLGFRRERATRSDRLAKETHGRALSDLELAKVWLAAGDETSFGRFIRFLILTGCRRSEGAGVRRSMILKTKPAAFYFPPAFTKQGRGHHVTITAQLENLIACCSEYAGNDLLFPSPRTGGQMSGWNKLIAKLVKSSGVPFSCHDLRRTFRTGLTQLGIDTETAELSLGHARENLIEIYDRSNGSEKVKAAFEAWATHVGAVCAAEIARRQKPDIFA